MGGAVVGSVFTAELHATAASAFDGWNVVLDLPPSLRYVAGSFSPSAFIPGLLALADLQGRSLSIGDTTLSEEEIPSGKGQLGTFEIEVTDAFVDSAEELLTNYTLFSLEISPVRGAPLQLERTTPQSMNEVMNLR